MAPRITMQGIEIDAPNRRGHESFASGGRPVRTLRAGPGEFTIVAVLWAGFGVYALSQGFVDDRAPLVIVGAASLAIIVVGVVWPIVALRGVAVAVIQPRDVNAGQTINVSVNITGSATSCMVRLIDPPSPWVHAHGPCTGVISLAAPHRGLYHGCRVELKTSGPLNVFTRHRWYSTRFASPLAVGPQAVTVVAPIGAANNTNEAPAIGAPAAASEAVRNVRPYVSGDAARAVHWPSSARTGALVVREFEPPIRSAIAIVCDLRHGEPATVERAASIASGLARDALQRGDACVLVTREQGGAVCEAVVSNHQVDRRLASAVVGDPGVGPHGWATVTVTPNSHVATAPAAPSRLIEEET